MNPIAAVFNNFLFVMQYIAPGIAISGIVWAGTQMLWGGQSHGGDQARWMNLLMGCALLLGASAFVNAIY